MLAGLIDDAAVFPPGNAALPDALVAHREHSHAWYADLVGPLLVPATDVELLPAPDLADLQLGLIGDVGLLSAVLPTAERAGCVRQVESAVAKRGEDPLPGLRSLLDWLADEPAAKAVTGYAEIPLSWGLLGALDLVAEARSGGLPVAPKFRTGGLAAELFPTPTELAAVICACRDRQLPFKLTAGLHHAVRHAERPTGFTYHGFLNVLCAAVVAADGGSEAEVAELLATIDRAPLVELIRPRLDQPRPLWVGFGSCSIVEPLTDLRQLGLLTSDGVQL